QDRPPRLEVHERVVCAIWLRPADDGPAHCAARPITLAHFCIRHEGPELHRTRAFPFALLVPIVGNTGAGADARAGEHGEPGMCLDELAQTAHDARFTIPLECPYGPARDSTEGRRETMKPRCSMRLAVVPLFAMVGLARADATPDLKSLYDDHQWIELRDAVKSSAKAPAFYRGAVDASFNNFSAADKHLRAALESAPPAELADAAHELLIELYMRSGRYRDTLGMIETALRRNPGAEDLKNVHALYSALSRFPEQTMAAHGASKVRYRMKQGNMFVPFTVNGKQSDFLVDTGANFSLISESEARRLGLQISDATGATMGDSSGTQLSFRIAM